MRRWIAVVAALAAVLLLTAGSPPPGSYWGGSFAKATYQNGRNDAPMQTWTFDAYGEATHNDYWPSDSDSVFADAGDGSNFTWWRVSRDHAADCGWIDGARTELSLQIGVTLTGASNSDAVCLDWDLSPLTDMGGVVVDTAYVAFESRYNSLSLSDGDGFRVVIDTLSSDLAAADADTFGPASDLRYLDVRWNEINDGVGWETLGSADTTFLGRGSAWDLGIVGAVCRNEDAMGTYTSHRVDCTDEIQQYIDWAAMKTAAGFSPDIAGIFLSGKKNNNTVQVRMGPSASYEEKVLFVSDRSGAFSLNIGYSSRPIKTSLASCLMVSTCCNSVRAFARFCLAASRAVRRAASLASTCSEGTLALLSNVCNSSEAFWTADFSRLASLRGLRA